MTKHKINNHDSPLAIYRAWEDMWVAIKEKQQ